MDGPSQGRLKNLCAVFKIPLSDCAASPEAALALLSHLYAMPLIKNKNDRHNYGNQILANTQGHFASNSNFVGRLGTHVIMMQELPAWYQNLNKSTDVLVEQYLDIERTVNFLNKVGYGSAGGAAAAGAAEMIKKGTVKEAAKKTAERFVGKGAIQEAIVGRIGQRAASAAPWVGAIIIVGGNLAYHGGLEQMEEIKNILRDRFQKGDMTNEQYKKVFGSQIDPDDVKKYWEM